MIECTWNEYIDSSDGAVVEVITVQTLFHLIQVQRVNGRSLFVAIDNYPVEYFRSFAEMKLRFG